MARALVVVALMAAVFGMASAVTYNVGEPEGSWDLQTNYAQWVANKRFHPGDELVFKYPAQQHDVLEVTKEAFDSCSISNPISTHTTGNDAIPLNGTGMRYFICGIGTHCANGMKLQVNVVSGATSLAPAGAPGSSPSTPSTPGGNSAATKTTAAGFGLAAVMLAAGLMA